MIQKKVCMLGSFAVGKTSLVERFVRGIYSDRYHTTVGVKIDKKVVQLGGQEIFVVLWDLHGEDEFQSLRTSYLRGMHGYLLVADGTRRATLDKALSLHERAIQAVGHVPFVLLLNKEDLIEEWEIDQAARDDLATRGLDVVTTSAQEGQGVEVAFIRLTEKMMAGT